MWSSFPERATRALFVGVVCCGSAAGAEYYVQPIASIGASYDSNIGLQLVPAERQSAVGYNADAAALLGIATHDSETTVEPRVVYNYYPAIPELDRVEGFFDLNSRLMLPRDQLSLAAEYQHYSDLHAEAPAPQYNPVNPGLPVPPTTGQIAYGATVNDVILQPSYSHNLTPLTRFGVSADLQRMSFSPADQFDHVDYDYGLARVFYVWSPTPRMSYSVDGFGSLYDASSVDARTHTGGVEVELDYHWTRLWQSGIEVQYQQARVDQRIPIMIRETVNAVGFSFFTTYINRRDQLHLNIGQGLAPSSAGGLYNTGEAHLEYDHDLSERLSTNIAGRYLRTRDVGQDLLPFARDYAVANAYLRWMLTRTLYVQGGYSFIWQKYSAYSQNAVDHSVQVQLGYRGLERQR